MELAWYCPSEGDGAHLGTRRAERVPDFAYLKAVARAAETAGAREILVPTGVVNDSFAPDAPFMESWTTAAALAAATERIRIIVAVNPAAQEIELIAHQATTLEAVAPGRVAINLVAGGGRDVGYGAPKRDHAARYARLGAMADAVRARFDGPFYLGGASPEAIALARRHAEAYLMWGEPPDAIAARIAGLRGRGPTRFGLRIHIIARPDRDEARQAAHELLAEAAVEGDRAAEFAAFDSVGQARMNALAADEDDWLADGLWAGIRRVRGGAGTALVGDYDQVAEWLGRYREAGVDFVIASGYPHLEEVRRVGAEVWPRLAPRPAAPIPLERPRDGEALAARFGTPLYVFDGPRLTRMARDFSEAWGPRTTIGYSMKCNPLMGVVAHLHRAGCAVEVASGFEYRAARRAGVPGSDIIFNGPLKSAGEMAMAFREGATVILDGHEQVEAALAGADGVESGARIGIRLTPPDTQGRDRFGGDPGEAEAWARRLRTAGLEVSGVHVHLGAYQLGPLPPEGPPIHGVTVQYPVPVTRFAAAATHAREVADQIGGIAWLDLGGGWPTAGDLDPYIAAVREALAGDDRELILEPGRALVRDSGWLLTRVVGLRGENQAIVDAGITHVPCVQWKRSPVTHNAASGAVSRPTDLFGPLCLQHDAIARDVLLPPLAVGDLLWVGQAGAYAIAQASPFIHLRPAAVLVGEGDRPELLRARETDDEALGAQAEPLLVGRRSPAVGE